MTQVPLQRIEVKVALGHSWPLVRLAQDQEERSRERCLGKTSLNLYFSPSFLSSLLSLHSSRIFTFFLSLVSAAICSSAPSPPAFQWYKARLRRELHRNLDQRATLELSRAVPPTDTLNTEAQKQRAELARQGSLAERSLPNSLAARKAKRAYNNGEGGSSEEERDTVRAGGNEGLVTRELAHAHTHAHTHTHIHTYIHIHTHTHTHALPFCSDRCLPWFLFPLSFAFLLHVLCCRTGSLCTCTCQSAPRETRPRSLSFLTRLLVFVSFNSVSSLSF